MLVRRCPRLIHLGCRPLWTQLWRYVSVPVCWICLFETTNCTLRPRSTSAKLQMWPTSPLKPKTRESINIAQFDLELIGRIHSFVPWSVQNFVAVCWQRDTGYFSRCWSARLPLAPFKLKWTRCAQVFYGYYGFSLLRFTAFTYTGGNLWFSHIQVNQFVKFSEYHL